MNRMSKITRPLAVAFLLAHPWTLPSADPAENWPQWRGPHLNGASSTARDLPVQWTQTENVLWRLKTPSWSAATPIIWEDTVLVTSAEEGFEQLSGYRRGGGQAEAGGKDKLLLLAVGRHDGSIRWRRVIGEGNRLWRKQNSASPSPVTDGSRIWVMTGNGTLTALDFEGHQLWQRNIQKDYGRFGLNHGYASSPLLYKDRLYIQVLHGMTTDDPSYVFAVDKASGKTIWKVERPTDAPAESPDDYSTPLPATVDGNVQLVVSGGDYVTGHDLATGKEIWRMGGFNPDGGHYYRTIASSLFLDGIVYTTSTRGKPFIAFRAGGEDDITETNQVWKNNLGPDVPTPTTDGKLIYVVNDKGIVTSFDAKTGEVVWDRLRIEPGTYSASPLLADGKLYATSEEGTTTAVQLGDEFKILGVSKLDDFTLASPVAAGNQIFIRTSGYLYCLAKQ